MGVFEDDVIEEDGVVAEEEVQVVQELLGVGGVAGVEGGAAVLQQPAPHEVFVHRRVSLGSVQQPAERVAL